MSSAPVKLLPVRYPVYHAISELNRSFEQAIGTLEHLISFNVFRPEVLRVYQVMVEEVRALVNEELTETANHRELANSRHYERLRLKHERGMNPEKESSSRASRKH